MVKNINMIENFLKPCINVIYKESYKHVLKEIVDNWSVNEKGVSFYDLYKKEIINSKNGLKKILDTLTNCGYITYRVEKAKTNSPKKKKSYYPTPLGVAMNTILTLLHPEELISDEKLQSRIKEILNLSDREYIEYLYNLADMYIQATLYNRLPDIYNATIALLLPEPSALSSFAKGYGSSLYAMNLLYAFGIGRDVSTLKLLKYSSSDRETLLEEVKQNIQKDLELIRWYQYLRSPVENKAVLQEQIKIEDYLENVYEIILKLIEVHEKHKKSSQIKT
jgi:hypothetical protein